MIAKRKFEGPHSFYSGATPQVVGSITALQITEEAVFDELTFDHPVDDANQLDIGDITFPPSAFLYNVKSFTLASGAVAVCFRSRESILPSPPVSVILNAEKLSLPVDTEVGTQVEVSNGFYVSGTGDSRDGFCFELSADNDYHDRHSYRVVGDLGIFYFGTLENDLFDGWILEDDNTHVEAATGSELFPWDADWSGDGITLTHPALQTLAAASDAQGGVSVAGGTQDGIYTDRGLINSRKSFTLIGQPRSEDGFYAIYWASDRWYVVNDSSVIYYAISDVATPDLASDWKNFSDDTPASIGISSVDEGTLAAGFRTTAQDTVEVSGGNINTDGIYTASPSSLINGKPVYEFTPGSFRKIFWDTEKWLIYSAFGLEFQAVSTVETPDLVTNWLTVLSVPAPGLSVILTQGTTTTFAISGSAGGRNKYSDVYGVADDIKWDEIEGKWMQGVIEFNPNNVFFPWFSGPPITTRSNVAAEANWVAT